MKKFSCNVVKNIYFVFLTKQTYYQNNEVSLLGNMLSVKYMLVYLVFDMHQYFYTFLHLLITIFHLLNMVK
jgi:hypothetical protein